MKLSKLKKMKMPEKKGPEAELDMEGMEMAEEMPEEEMPEMEGEMEAEALAGEESPEEERAELAMLSDEELLAELKKRGLSKQLEGSEEELEADEDQEMYS